MATPKTVIIENISKRAWIVAGVTISPTAAVTLPGTAAELPAVLRAIEEGELKISDEEKDAKIIKTEEEARQVQRDNKANKSNA